MDVKYCHKCQQVKPVAEFSKDSQKYDGLCWWCDDCRNAASKRRAKLAEQGRNARLASYPTEMLLRELYFRGVLQINI